MQKQYNMVAIVDCNNFYASCERIFQPALEKKPVVVLSNNDGCVIARSEEAKALGIEMGAPAFMMEAALRRNDVHVFSSNYTLYGSLSSRVMQMLDEACGRVESYSIDEAFLDLNDCTYTSPVVFAHRLRRQLQKHIGIPVTIGIAATKTLAKMANRYAKKSRAAMGVYCLDTPLKIRQVLQATAVGDIWGVGAQHRRRLLAMGVNSAADFIQLSPEWVRSHMTVTGERLLSELKGVPAIGWEEEPAPKKAICIARSFGTLLTEKNDIAAALANYTAACAAKLRRQKSCAGTLQVFLQTNVHRSADRQYFNAVTLQLPLQTNSTNILLKHATDALHRVYREGYHFKKVGVIMMDLVPEASVQCNLFTAENKEKNTRVMQSLDHINSLFGKDLVRFASQGYDTKWKLRQLRLSPCCTTDINQVITIKN